MSASAPLSEPHHDGSPLYVPEQPAEIGDEVAVRIRVPRASGVDVAAVRYVRDGEPRGVPAVVDEETDTDTWWRATVPIWNPTVSYRWVLGGGEVGYAWINGAGLFRHDVPDDLDFMLSVAPAGPDWHAEGVVYEIFPDRFATTGAYGLNGDRPDWAVPRGWDEAPTGRGPTTPFELFGGDLPGIEQHLDHVERLGASILYLTPVFPASSTHRYDAASFGRVDPLLGGDEALASLTRAAHARGLRVLGDLTLNHCGAAHEWFVAAQQSPDAPERELFYFDDSLPGGYESWLGVRSLPKLAWGSPELRRRMTEVARRWLEPPYELDGWRIDVANMVGRYRELALTTERRERDPQERRGEAARRRARARLPLRPAGRRLAREHELRGLPAPRLDVAARRRPAGGAAELLLEHPRRAAAAAGGRRRDDDAELPRRAPLGPPPALVDAARQPRHGALPHRRRLTRAAARRRRPADDDAGRADGVRRRRDRPRGRLGRGRPPHDAVGPARDLGRAHPRRLPGARRAAALEPGARPRRHPLRPRLGRRDRLPARAARRAPALPRRARSARARAAAARPARLRRARDARTAATCSCRAATPCSPPTDRHSMSGDSRDGTKEARRG